MVRQKWRLLKAALNERARRHWAGAEADAIGYGGVVAVARATGMAISTVRKGSDGIRAGAVPDDVINVRRSTGKRPHEAAYPEVWPALEKLVDPLTRADPESPLRWTCKSTHVLTAELFAQHEIRVSERGVPVTSVDTKARELVGNFKNGGREWQPEREPRYPST